MSGPGKDAPVGRIIAAVDDAKRQGALLIMMLQKVDSGMTRDHKDWTEDDDEAMFLYGKHYRILSTGQGSFTRVDS